MFSDEKKKYALQCRQYQRLPRALNRHRWFFKRYSPAVVCSNPILLYIQVYFHLIIYRSPINNIQSSVALPDVSFFRSLWSSSSDLSTRQGKFDRKRRKDNEISSRTRIGDLVSSLEASTAWSTTEINYTKDRLPIERFFWYRTLWSSPCWDFSTKKSQMNRRLAYRDPAFRDAMISAQCNPCRCTTHALSSRRTPAAVSSRGGVSDKN
jgi:hypothetical protein